MNTKDYYHKVDDKHINDDERLTECGLLAVDSGESTYWRGVDCPECLKKLTETERKKIIRDIKRDIETAKNYKAELQRFEK